MCWTGEKRLYVFVHVEELTIKLTLNSCIYLNTGICTWYLLLHKTMFSLLKTEKVSNLMIAKIHLPSKMHSSPLLVHECSSTPAGS